MDLELATNSRFGSVRACDRKHYYAYELQYRPVHEPLPLVFGTVGHHAAEAYWVTRKNGGEPADRRAAMLKVLAGSQGARLNEYERAKLTALMLGYAVLWDPRLVRVIAVEAQFRAPLINPETGAASRTFQLGGKLDVLVELLRDGRTAFIEHKFSGESAAPGTAYRKRLAIDGQIDQYYTGCDALGYPADVAIYDVICKPKIRPLRATPIDKQYWVVNKKTKEKRLKAKQRLVDETPAQYMARLLALITADPTKFYQWVLVPRLAGERVEYQYDVWQLARRIADNRRLGHRPRNPDACHRYGTECAFWDVCTGGAQLTDTSKFRRATSQHEELESGTPEGAET
jgi:hypothetical protein